VRIHQALEERHLQCDPLPDAADLSGYPVAILSSGVYLSRDASDRLVDYVHRGGVLIAAGPVGQFDEHSWPDGRMLRQVWGVRDVERLSARRVKLADGSEVQGPQAPNASWRFPAARPDAEVLATWPDGTPAALKARHGNGTAILVGWAANTAMGTLMQHFVVPACRKALRPAATCDNQRVRIFIRKNDTRHFVFVFNEVHTSPDACRLSFGGPTDVTDLRLGLKLTGRREIELDLMPGDCRVLAITKPTE